MTTINNGQTYTVSMKWRSLAYSITSSAMASAPDGMTRPSPLAALRLIAFFCSAPDHRPQNSGCSHTAQRFHTAWVKNRTPLWRSHVSFRQVRTCSGSAAGHLAGP
jgi:hypothetical protein